jgi:hypothetical protein
MPYQSAYDLLQNDQMKRAQLGAMGQEGRLRDLQMQGAMDDRAQKGRLRDLFQQLPEGADPAILTKLLMREGPEGMALAGHLQQLSQKAQPKFHVVGGALVPEPTAGQNGQVSPVYQAPEKPEKVNPNQPFMMVNGHMIPNKEYQAYEERLKRAGKTDVNVGFPKETFKNERDLRTEFQGLPTTKAFKEVQTAYDQINYALSNPSAASDLAAATKYMKILDPGSVVRESELGMAMAATGKIDQLSNYYNRLQTGEKLTPSQRKDFSKLAKGLYDAAAGRYNESAAEYRGMAKEYGLNPERTAKETPIQTGPEQPSIPKTANSLPNPATLPNGAIVTDTVSGRKMVVNNGKYQPAR